MTLLTDLEGLKKSIRRDIRKASMKRIVEEQDKVEVPPNALDEPDVKMQLYKGFGTYN